MQLDVYFIIFYCIASNGTTEVDFILFLLHLFCFIAFVALYCFKWHLVG